MVTKAPEERAQDVRDLRRQISGLEKADESEIVFRDTSPVRKMATLYSVADGEMIRVPRKLLDRMLEKRLPDGRDMFTARKSEAPAYKRGTVKCFLHRESVDRPILEEIGLGAMECPAASLASQFSKRIHAQRRHKQEWAAYQEYIEENRRVESEDRARQQLDATLALAGRAANQSRSRT